MWKIKRPKRAQVEILPTAWDGEGTPRADAPHYWRLVAANGVDVLCHSQNYADRDNAEEGVRAARRALLAAGKPVVVGRRPGARAGGA